MKVIIHLDLDSFFASAHRTVDKSLFGKSLVVSMGGRRSIIAAASYEARAKGIKAAMPLYKAKELDPNVTVVEPNFALYTMLSDKVFELLSNKYTRNIEVASVDECYLDATDIWQKYGSPKALALDIQKNVLKELKLPISLGVSDNKFVAKMSTSVNKPLGVTITKPGDFLKLASDWPIEKFHGIGTPTGAKLREIKIDTIGKLAKANPEDIKDLLGVVGPILVAQANGFGSDEIDSSMNDLKGIGNSITFQWGDKHDKKEILEVFYQLCSMVSHRALSRNVVGYVVAVMLKESGGKEVKAVRKQTTLVKPINSHEEIYEVVKRLFDQLWNGDTIKFVGIHLGKLANMFDTTYQTNIFEEDVDNRTEVEKLISKVNKQLKTKAVVTATEGKLTLDKNRNQSRYIETDRLISHKDIRTKKKN